MARLYFMDMISAVLARSLTGITVTHHILHIPITLKPFIHLTFEIWMKEGRQNSFQSEIAKVCKFETLRIRLLNSFEIIRYMHFVMNSPNEHVDKVKEFILMNDHFNKSMILRFAY